MGYGFAGFVGFAKEVSWGSGVAVSSGDFIEALSESISLDIDRFKHKTMIGTMAEPDDTAGLRRIGGSIAFAAVPHGLGHMLKSVLQAKSLTVIASGVLFTNEYYSTAIGNDFSTDVPSQPYTFEIFRDVTSSQRYTGCVADTLSMTFEPNNAVMCEATFVGRGASIIARSGNPTFPNSPNKPFTFDTVSLSVGGAGTVLIESLKVTIDNQLEGIGALNQSTDIAKIRRTGHQMVSVGGTLDFTTVNEYLNFINQSTQRFTISATKGNSFQLIVDMPQVLYTSMPMGVNAPDRLTIDFEGKAQYHAGSGTAIKVSLTTTNSTY